MQFKEMLSVFVKSGKELFCGAWGAAKLGFWDLNLRVIVTAVGCSILARKKPRDQNRLASHQPKGSRSYSGSLNSTAAFIAAHSPFCFPAL